jgi:Flp pilus assembly pilin Flp
MPAYFANLAVVAAGACHRLAQERGQTLVEYSLILVLLAMVAVATLSFVGADVAELFTSAEGRFRNASTP